MARSAVTPPRRAGASSSADDVAAAASGDEAAFARLHRRHARAVAAVLLSRLPAQDVDDLVQEVFLDAWRTLPSLREVERFLPWLATIARRKAARYHRDRRPADEPLLDEPGDPTAGPGRDGAEILACLRGLPEAYRETLTLRLVEGLSGPEIAALTGLTHDSVRVNLSRGMARLREALTRRGWP